MNHLPHKVMTAKEYANLHIHGWHEVYRNVDGMGGVGVRYMSAETRPDELVETLSWVRKNYAGGCITEINARIDAALAKARG